MHSFKKKFLGMSHCQLFEGRPYQYGPSLCVQNLMFGSKSPRSVLAYYPLGSGNQISGNLSQKKTQEKIFDSNCRTAGAARRGNQISAKKIKSQEISGNSELTKAYDNTMDFTLCALQSFHVNPQPTSLPYKNK